jgi:hypothetical protein
LAVSSATDTVHIFKLKGGNGEGEKKRGNSGPSSPGGSVDSQDTGKGGAGMEGGYEAYMDGKKKNGMGCVLVSFLDQIGNLCWHGSSLGQKCLGIPRGTAGMNADPVF